MPGDKQPFSALRHHTHWCCTQSRWGHCALHYRGQTTRKLQQTLTHFKKKSRIHASDVFGNNCIIIIFMYLFSSLEWSALYFLASCLSSLSLLVSALGPGGLCPHSVAEFPRPHCWLPSPQPLLGWQQGAVGLHFQMDQRLLHGADGGCNLSQVLRHCSSIVFHSFCLRLVQH